MTADGKISTYSYDPAGRLTSKSMEGYTTSYTYNNGGMITDVKNMYGEAVLRHTDYMYYLDGNMESVLDYGDESIKFYTYDGIGRLKEEMWDKNTEQIALFTYSYDSAGNRSTKTVTGEMNYSESYTYDLNNRLTRSIKTENGESITTDYGYDRNGNMLSMIINSNTPTTEPSLGLGRVGVDTSGITVNEYDTRNRLIKTINDSGTTEYSYHPDGMRKSKTHNGTQTSYIWNGMNMIAEIKNGEAIYHTYDQTGIAMSNKNGTYSYYLKNAHGDVISLADGSGSITQSYIYDAFGNQLNKSETDTNPFRYCGEYQDLCSGLIYLRNRYYNPNIGRFISEDPIRDGMNWYVYTGNNPVNNIDKNGLWDERVHVGETIRIFDEMGFNSYHAEIVANANISVDQGDMAATNQNNVAQSRHFDRNPDSNIDSREVWANACLNDAIEHWNSANELYNEGRISLQQRHDMRVGALQSLGRGLHSLQDIDAHLDMKTDNFSSPIRMPHLFEEDNILEYSNVDNPRYDAEATDEVGKYIKIDSGTAFGSQRYRNTVNRTKEYLNQFYSNIDITE